MSATSRLLSILFVFILCKPYAQKNTFKLHWELAGKMPSSSSGVSSGVAGAITGIYRNKLIIAGGANFPDGLPWKGGQKKYYNQFNFFHINEGVLTLHENSYKLPEAIAYAAYCITPEGIFYAGGENHNGLSNRSYLIKYDSLQSSISVKNLPDLPKALTNCSAVHSNERIIVAGGDGVNGTSDQVYTLSLNDVDAGWSIMPSLPKPSANGLLFVSNEHGEVNMIWVGGRRKTSSGISELSADVYVFNFNLNYWKPLLPLPYPLCAGTGSMINPSSIILFGGETGTTFTTVEKFLAKIAVEKDPDVRLSLIKSKNQVLEDHPGFSNEILLYQIKTGESSVVGKIPFEVPVTTGASWLGDYIFIPSGEIRAGVRTPNIISVKIK